MNFDEAFTRLLGHEGGYSNNPADPGSETMWGVTAITARENGYKGRMRDLPQDFAKQIYRKSYWDAVQADSLPDFIRFDVFDGAVNSGPRQSVKWLQRSTGAKDDGIVGPLTIKATKDAGPAALSRYNGHRLLFMTQRPVWKNFGKGWAIRIANNLLEA